MTERLAGWLAAQERASIAALLSAISAQSLRHYRPGFGQTIVPAKGSVLASVAQASWDPEPDYFYHWVRDAAVVMATLSLLFGRRDLGKPDIAKRDDIALHFADIVAFSHWISTRPAPHQNPLAATTEPSHQRFLRPDEALQHLDEDALLGEPRVNADGTADFERWSRPQFDGPALRALSCLSWRGPKPPQMDALLEADLAHVLRHAAMPCVGPWEEEPPTLHGFTLLAQRAALAAVKDRLDQANVTAAMAKIDEALIGLWCAEHQTLRASRDAANGESDASLVLGALLGDPQDTHIGISAPKVLATARHVEAWSRRAYAVARSDAPLVGRWEGDIYFDGNPWLPTSFGFAEFYYRHAGLAPSIAAARAAFNKADAFLHAISCLLPHPGALPEQLDRNTGVSASCRDLAWSHAALIAAAEARRCALRR